jgi:hypothetical protein
MGGSMMAIVQVHTLGERKDSSATGSLVLYMQLATCNLSMANQRPGPSLAGGLAGLDSSACKEAACGDESCDGHMREGLRFQYGARSLSRLWHLIHAPAGTPYSILRIYCL